MSPLLLRPVSLGLALAAVSVAKQAFVDPPRFMDRLRNFKPLPFLLTAASLILMLAAVFKECWESANGMPLIDPELDCLVGLGQSVSILLWIAYAAICESVPGVSDGAAAVCGCEAASCSSWQGLFATYILGVLGPVCLTLISALVGAAVGIAALTLAFPLMFLSISPASGRMTSALSFTKGLLLSLLANDFAVQLCLDGVDARACAVILLLILAMALAAPFLRRHIVKGAFNADKEIVADLNEDPYGALEMLSAREKQVLVAWLGGMRNSDIALELGLRPGTVGTYRNRAAEKLGVDVAELESMRRRLLSKEDTGVVVENSPEIPFWEGLLLTLLLLAAVVPAKGGLPLSALKALAFVFAAFAVFQPDDREVEVDASFPYRWIWPWVSGALLMALTRLAAIIAVSPTFYFDNLGLCIIVAFCVVGGACWPTADAEGKRRPFLVPGQKAGCYCASLGTGLSYASYTHLSLGLGPTRSCVVLMALFGLLLYKTREELMVTGSGCEKGDEDRTLSYLKGRGLNDLQAQVALLTCNGKSRKQICETLCIAPGTVNSYRSTAYRVLGVHSAAELRDLLGSEAGLRLS